MDLEAVKRGFTGQAAVYDAYGAGHPAIRWARGQVRARVTERLAPGARLLELNAGTGEDAAYFAERGYWVHATDVADGMLAEIARKAAGPALGGRLTVQACSFLDLRAVTGGPYDLVFSNFGGLNCAPDLRPVAAGLPAVLRPGGQVVWVVMPPVCPWELAQLARGRWRVALRRVRGRTLARVAGAAVPTYYFTPAAVRAALGPDFCSIQYRSLALFSPPAFMDGFPHRFPRLFHWLTRLDERVGGWPLLNTWGDFVTLTAEYRPR